MAAKKVVRSTKKPKVVYRYKADHKKSNKAAEDCVHTITDGSKKDSITRDCTKCNARKAKFKYDGEVTPNSLK